MVFEKNPNISGCHHQPTLPKFTRHFPRATLLLTLRQLILSSDFIILCFLKKLPPFTYTCLKISCSVTSKKRLPGNGSRESLSHLPQITQPVSRQARTMMESSVQNLSSASCPLSTLGWQVCPLLSSMLSARQPCLSPTAMRPCSLPVLQPLPSPLLLDLHILWSLTIIRYIKMLMPQIRGSENSVQQGTVTNKQTVTL